ncbi:MAG TPA: hypothetical protein VFT43_00940 [Candidatus Polarisedimenticolia bacterium]|nr:hypothetical protein [Candidatus Polarisedimenticolia bacterium]
MRRATVVVVALLCVTGLASAERDRSEKPGAVPPAPRILAFDAMYGVDGPFVGPANPIRGIVGDEQPWVVADHVRGRLDARGHLKIQVRGLVFADEPSVPPELRGKNDEEAFRGAVSCLTESGPEVSTANVFTQGFPASTTGDSDIDASVVLPNPCVAPIVFVLAGSEDKWFAVTGFESPEE